MESVIEFVAGIDGGGTKTTVLCCDMQGTVLAEQKFGAFNLNSIGEEGFIQLLKEITSFLQRIGKCRAVCIGAAGISNHRMHTLTASAMQQAGITNWQLVGDHEIALYGALEGQPGISLVAGTGSICFARNAKGETARVGGWGHLIGDEGSGYAVGRDALRAITRFWDGCGEKTSLVEALQEELQIAERQTLIAYIYGHDKSKVADISKIVEKEAKKGDWTANKILKDNAEQLLDLIAAAAKRTQMSAAKIAMFGGLLENDTVFRKYLITAVEEQCPGFTCVLPKQNAAMGAAMLAKNQISEGL